MNSNNLIKFLTINYLKLFDGYKRLKLNLIIKAYSKIKFNGIWDIRAIKEINGNYFWRFIKIDDNSN